MLKDTRALLIVINAAHGTDAKGRARPSQDTVPFHALMSFQFDLRHNFPDFLHWSPQT